MRPNYRLIIQILLLFGLTEPIFLSQNLSAMHGQADLDPCPTVTPLRKAVFIASFLCEAASETCAGIASSKITDCDQKLKWETADLWLHTAGLTLFSIGMIWNKVKAALSSEPSATGGNYQAV